MTTAAELHVQTDLWTNHDQRFAVLIMEGESPDRANGGEPLADALYTAVLARGLRMTTDLDQLPLRPVRGWHLRIADSGAITLQWPHVSPLLADVPLRSPQGWEQAAKEMGVVLVLVGWCVGLHEHARDGNVRAVDHLLEIAENGMLAGGAVAVTGSEATAAELDGMVAWHRRDGHHRPAEAGSRFGRPKPRWWSTIINGHHGV